MNEQVKDLADLIVIEPKDALATFTTPGALDPILALVRARIDAFEADVSTPAGRKQVEKMAFAVVKSRTALKAIGDALAKDVKDLPKKLDAGRKYAKDKLEAWEAEVRAPLTEWETAEDARIKRHTDALAEIKRLAEQDVASLPVDALDARMKTVANFLVTNGEEFAEEYAIASRSAMKALGAAIVARRQFEADQAELAELRRLKAEADAREAAAKALRDAEERQKAEEAKIAAEAEKAAQRERDAAVARENALKAQAEADARREAEQAAEREAALKAQTEAAERRARETEERVRREIEANAATERRARAERELNREHRRKINIAALDGIATLLFGKLAIASATEEVAKDVLAAIIKGEVPHVSINY